MGSGYCRGMLPDERRRLAREIMECLNEYRIRATYPAVAEVVYGSRANAFNVNERLLGPARPKGSWIVNAGGIRPRTYPEGKLHPDLSRSSHIIDDGEELKALLTAYRLGIRTGPIDERR